MDNVEKILTPEEVVDHMLRCKIDVYEKIEDIHQRLEAGADRMYNIETTLAFHGKQRDEHAKALKEDIQALRGDFASSRNDFNTHDRKEMEKYDQIIVAIDKLSARLENTAIDTEKNTDAIDSKKQEEMIARIKKEAIDEHDAPYKEYRKKAILTVITIVTTALTYGTWQIVMFMAELNSKISGG